jgi:hypothetical protein
MDQAWKELKLTGPTYLNCQGQSNCQPHWGKIMQQVKVLDNDDDHRNELQYKSFYYKIGSLTVAAIIITTVCCR